MNQSAQVIAAIAALARSAMSCGDTSSMWVPIDQTWLSLMLKERPTGITGSCNYKRDLLDGGTVRAWLADLVALLEAAAAQPGTPLGQLLARKAA